MLHFNFESRSDTHARHLLDLHAFLELLEHGGFDQIHLSQVLLLHVLHKLLARVRQISRGHNSILVGASFAGETYIAVHLLRLAIHEFLLQEVCVARANWN